MQAPNPGLVQRGRDPLSHLGLPILALVAILALTSLVASSRGAGALECWRLDRGVALTAPARLCLTTPPVLRAGVVAVYSPLAPVTWLRAWFPNARVSIHDMNAPDRKRVQRAMDMVLQAWTIGGSIAVALFILSAMLMATTRKSQRVQIYGTRFWAQPDEIYASGLLVGYQPPRVERIRAALRRWTGER